LGIRIGRPEFLELFSSHYWFRRIAYLHFKGKGIKFLIWRLCRKLRLHPRDQWLKNYQIYSVAGAIFQTNWWMWLWEQNQFEINEGRQLERAMNSFLQNPLLTVGYKDPAVAKTSIRSSSQEVSQIGRLDFPVSLMNQVLNTSWLDRSWKINEEISELDQMSVLRAFSAADLPESFGDDWIQWWRSIEADRKRLGFPSG
jgi:hypothetical protein